MHSTFAAASLLIASAYALPQAATASTSADTDVSVLLQSQSIELGFTVDIGPVTALVSKPVADSTDKIETFDLNVGAGAKQDLRCQALGLDGIPLIATRGPNRDTSFSDGGDEKGAWTFETPSVISKIVCDPAFVQIADIDAPENSEIRVQLSGPGELATQTPFENFKDAVSSGPVGSRGLYDQISITVGAKLNPETRCSLLNGRNKAIKAVRGTNADGTPKGDVTFSKGNPWTFDKPRFVNKITCDPKFVAEPFDATDL